MATTPTMLQPGSTSTNEGGNKSPKQRVRPRQAEPMSAYQLVGKEETFVTLPSGHVRACYAKEWIVCRNDKPVEVLSDEMFHRLYEPVLQGLVLPAKVLGWLEEHVGLGSTKDPKALMDGIQRLVDLKVGSISVDFTPAQYEELKLRAEKRGSTLTEEITRVVEHLTSDVFWRV